MALSTMNVATTTNATAAESDKGYTLGQEKVRRVTLAEYKEAAQCLAEAFADDDVARYFTHTPDREHWSEAQRWELHVCILEYIVYAHILNGLVLTVGENYDCVALWMPPGRNMDDYMTILRSGMWRLWYKLSTEGKTRFFYEFFTVLHDTKTEVMGARDNDSYYLVYVGTKPSGRGKGYARKVIETVTSDADKESRACYLESSNAANPIIYRKLGFEVVKKIVLKRAEKDVELEIMIREPRGVPETGSLEKVGSFLEAQRGGVPQVSVALKMGSEKEAVASISVI